MPLAIFQQDDHLGEISGGVAAADAVTHAEGPVVMRSQDVQDGLASLQQYGPGHAVFNNR